MILTDAIWDYVLSNIQDFTIVFKRYVCGYRGSEAVKRIKYKSGPILSYTLCETPVGITWYVSLSYPYITYIPIYWKYYSDYSGDFVVVSEGDKVVIDRVGSVGPRNGLSDKILLARLTDADDAWFDIDVTETLKGVRLPRQITVQDILPYLLWRHNSRDVSKTRVKLSILWDETYDEVDLTAEDSLNAFIERYDQQTVKDV